MQTFIYPGLENSGAGAALFSPSRHTPATLLGRASMPVVRTTGSRLLVFDC